MIAQGEDPKSANELRQIAKRDVLSYDICFEHSEEFRDMVQGRLYTATDKLLGNDMTIHATILSICLIMD